MKCRESSETRFGKVWAWSEPCLRGKRPIKVYENCTNFDFLGVEKWNVGNRLKRVLAKFQADRSHVWGVNGRSKFPKIFEIREIVAKCRTKTTFKVPIKSHVKKDHWYQHGGGICFQWSKPSKNVLTLRTNRIFLDPNFWFILKILGKLYSSALKY